jgi:hypothetical protein
MILVANTIIDENTATATFCCDLQACKGVCCCLEGGRGAPLDDDEVSRVAEAFPYAKEYLNERSLEVIAREGLVEGWPGSYATPCIEHRECVFVYYQDGIAKCAFERAWLEGKTSWRKPISCHLFPIRVRHVGQTILRYEQMPECTPGQAHGEAKGILLVDFLKDALTRAFGTYWFAQLKEKCGSRE